MTPSRIIGILAFIATALTTVASVLETIAPKYAVWALAISAAISAFTGRIQGAKPEDETVRRLGQ